MSDKIVLITGGAGFIGSHLCDLLIRRGIYVLCLDNFFTGSISNISHLKNNDNFELIRHDVISPILLEVHEIFHLACPASPIYYQYNPVKTVKTSVMGSINMLGLAKRIKARVLFSSTSEVYGDPQEHPQKETYWGHVNPVGLRSCYDEGKRVAETLFMDYHRQNNVDIRIARIFNTYGPRMAVDDGRVISNFIVQALKNKDITIYGDGDHTRSFCYISDMIEGLDLLMRSGFSVGPVNLGNPEEHTIIELANLIKEMTGSRSKLVFKPLPNDDPVRRKPDISLAIEKLNWAPKTKLSTGLEKTINYYEKYLSFRDLSEYN